MQWDNSFKSFSGTQEAIMLQKNCAHKQKTHGFQPPCFISTRLLAIRLSECQNTLSISLYSLLTHLFELQEAFSVLCMYGNSWTVEFQRLTSCYNSLNKIISSYISLHGQFYLQGCLLNKYSTCYFLLALQPLKSSIKKKKISWRQFLNNLSIQ